MIREKSNEMAGGRERERDKFGEMVGNYRTPAGIPLQRFGDQEVAFVPVCLLKFNSRHLEKFTVIPSR